MDVEEDMNSYAFAMAAEREKGTGRREETEL